MTLKQRVDGCKGCEIDCGHYVGNRDFFNVSGKFLNRDVECCEITVKSEWLDKNARKVGYACLDELFFYDEKPELLEELVKMAIDENAIIRIFNKNTPYQET